ncbi:MAG: DUF1194 domain-containing protein [Alphaproteobacteria bacterium]
MPGFRKSCGSMVAVLTFATGIASAPVSAQDVPVDLELVLATDVSASIDLDEASLQRDGYIAALTDAAVIDAIRFGFLGRIAVVYVEWAGAQRTIVDWTIIEDSTGAHAFVDALRSAPRTSGASTSISGALDYAATLFQGNGFNGSRRVIDISGDGRNQAGRPLRFARADTLADGVTINALPLLFYDADGRELNPGLDRYYLEHVVGGPGAFALPARGLGAFPEAIRKKLIIEISGVAPPISVARATERNTRK